MIEPQPFSSTSQRLPINLDRLVFWAVMLLVFAMAARTPLDSDLWWHLKAGQTTVETFRPLTSDPFSFTRTGETWVNHSWLGQVLLYGVYQIFGTVGLSALTALCAAASLGLVYDVLEAPALFKAFLLVLSGVVAAPVWTPRPQIFSLLFFAGLFRLVFEYRRGNFRHLVILIPLFFLWSNLHGGYILGITLIILALAGSLMDNFLAGDQGNSLSLRQCGQLAFWSVLGYLAVIANPNGIQTLLIPFQTVGVQALQNSISEWASPDFHQISQVPMLVWTALLLLVCGRSGRRLSWIETIPSLGFLVSAFYARRNFGPYALVTLPILASQGWLTLTEAWQNSYPWLKKILPAWLFEKKISRPLPVRVTRWINGILLTVLALVAAVKCLGVSLPTVVDRYEAELYPRAAVTWLQLHQPAGAMLNDYGWGGYLIWRLPTYPVFVDGRTDLYGDEIIGQWTQVVNAQPGWEDTLDRWNIRVVFLSPSWPVTSVLEYSGWELAYQDNQAVIYVR